MTYTPEQLLTIIGALGVLIAAFGAVVVNIIVALKTGQKTDSLLQKTDVVAARVEQVHVLTNSNLSAVKAELTNAMTEIRGLVQIVSDLKSEREKTSLAAASAMIPPSAPRTANQRATDQPETIQKVEIVQGEDEPVPVQVIIPPGKPAKTP